MPLLQFAKTFVLSEKLDRLRRDRGAIERVAHTAL